MPKSQIIKDIVEDAVPLEKSLTRLMVLAKDIENDKLAKWAEKEIQGYSREDDLPEYRIIKSRQFVYSGINGNFKVKNTPLPEEWMGKGVAKQVAELYNYDGIKYLSSLAEAEHMPCVDLSRFAGNVSIATGDAVQCTEIYQKIPQSLYQGICNTVKMKMLTALLELEKKYGCLDDLGIDISNRNAVQIKTDNDSLNEAVFNITLSKEPEKKVSWYAKITWNVVAPIITGVLGALLSAMAIKYFNL